MARFYPINEEKDPTFHLVNSPARGAACHRMPTLAAKGTQRRVALSMRPMRRIIALNPDEAWIEMFIHQDKWALLPHSHLAREKAC
jgi:hypothetical protein